MFCNYNKISIELQRFRVKHKLSKGRPKGPVNHNTRFIREALKEIIIDNIPQIKYDLGELETIERIDAIIKLAKYVLPQMKQETKDVIDSNDDFNITGF